MARAYERGITIVIDADTTGLSKAFKQVRSDLKEATGEIQDIENLLGKQNIFSNWSGSTELLRQEQNKLRSDIELTRQKIEIEKQALNNLSKEDQTPEVIRNQEKLQREIISDQQHLEELTKKLKDFGSVGQQQAFMVAEEFKKTGEKIAEVGSDIKNAGKQLSLKVTAPIVAAGTTAVNSAMDFESAMAKVKSVSLDATEDDMENLAETAIEMSNSSKYSASEIAEAMYYMGLAGWHVEEIYKGLPAVLNLAAAGDLNLARASDIVTDYVTAFGKEAGEATHLADVMAQTMTNSNTTVDLMGETFKYVAPVAGAMGYSMEDVSIAIGLMANNGIKGSQAGTSLRFVMQRLAKPTAEVQNAMDELGLSLEDDEGNMYSFMDIMNILRDAFNGSEEEVAALQKQLAIYDSELENGTITEEEYAEAVEEAMQNTLGLQGAEKAKNAAIIAGTRGMSGLLAIVNATSEDYEELTAKIYDSKDATKEIAEIMMDTTEGSMLQMQHQIENVGISFGNTMIPYVQKAIDKIKEITKWFSNLNEEQRESIVKAGAVAAAAGPLLVIAGSVIESIGKITSGTGSLIKMVASHPVASGVGFLTTALAVGIIEAKAYNEEVKRSAEELYGLTDAEEELINKIDDSNRAVQRATESRSFNVGVIENEYGWTKTLIDRLDELVDENGFVKEGYKERANFILQELSEATGLEIELTGNLIKGYQDLKTSILEANEERRNSALLTEAEKQYQDAIAGQAEAFENYTQALNSLEEAKEKESEVTARLNEAEAKYSKLTDVNNPKTRKARDEVNRLKAEVEAATERTKELSEAAEISGEVYFGYTNTIENYNEVMYAMANGGMEEVTIALEKMVRGFVTADSATAEMVKSQARNFQEQYDVMKRALESGMPGITQAQVDQMKVLVDASLTELAKLPAGAATEQAKLIDTLDAPGEFQRVGIANGRAYRDALNSTINTKSSGKNFVLGFVEGINDNVHLATSAASRLAQSTTSKFNAVLGVNSPAKVTMDSGFWFDKGFGVGVEKYVDEAINPVKDLANDAASAMQINPAIWQSPTWSQGSDSGRSVNHTSNYGDIIVNVSGANVQDEQTLAEMIADRINREVYQRKAAFA